MKKKFETSLSGVGPHVAKTFPFWSLLPKRALDMLKVRLYIRERCLTDEAFRHDIEVICKKDCAFFIQVFGFWHETRAGQQQFGKFPVLLDPDQVDILAWWVLHAGQQDVVLDKTRGIGCSYLIASFALHLWYSSESAIDIGLLSKDDTSLDAVGRPSTLMGKLDLIWGDMPIWMQKRNGKPVLRRTHENHKFANNVTGTAIFGYTATDQKLRSARLYCLFVDEAAFLPVDVQRWLAAAHGTTPSIIYVSTHNGTACMFYRLTQDDKTDLIRISSYWWNNRRCAAGLYKFEKNSITILDKRFRFPADYEFDRSRVGELRSPWVDRAFNRPGANPQAVYEELYGIAAAHGRKMFTPAVLNGLRASSFPPVARGDVDETGFVDDDLSGGVYFWESPEGLSGRYMIGVDPALGSQGGAYAGVAVWNIETGLLTASAQLPDCSPVQLAALVTHLARLLAGPRGPQAASIAYESTGIGVAFGNELKRLGWPALARPEGKDTPGFSNTDRGETWLVELGRALAQGDAVARDLRLFDDMSGFEYDVDFQLQYASTDGHGDLAIAAAIAWSACKKYHKARGRERASAYNYREPTVDDEPRVRERKRQLGQWSMPCR